MSFVWPLASGASWEQIYHYERPAAKLSYDASYAGRVEAEESVRMREPALAEGERTRELLSFTLAGKNRRRRRSCIVMSRWPCSSSP